MTMYLIAHNIRSLHNVGAIFRCADVFGVEKIYLTGYTGHPPRKEIAKTALGSEHRVTWESVEDIMKVITELHSKAFHIIALETGTDAVTITAFMLKEPFALLIGNERDGIPQELLALCDQKVVIPMPGIKRSLNVSVATGIALFVIANKK